MLEDNVVDDAQDNAHIVGIGDIVHVWIEADDGELRPIPGIVTSILDEEKANIVVFPDTGVNDLRAVFYSDEPHANHFTLIG